ASHESSGQPGRRLRARTLAAGHARLTGACSPRLKLRPLAIARIPPHGGLVLKGLEWTPQGRCGVSRQEVQERTIQAEIFAHPFTYWVGMDTDPRTTPEALAEFNHFYSTTHVGEVIAAHPGFVSVSRYELLDPDPRGGVHAGPRWLAVYEMTDEAAAQQYIKDNA